MNLIHIAKRITKNKGIKKPKKVSKDPVEVPDISVDILNPGMEYSYDISISFSVDFEGDIDGLSDNKIKRKLKNEIVSAMKSAALITANDIGLLASNIRVNPVSINSAINDSMSVDEK